MSKMPYSGKYHGDPGSVGSVNGVLIADGATWLYDGLNAVFGGKLDTVIEWEEGVRSHYGPFNIFTGVLNSDLQGIDPVWLAGAHSKGPFTVSDYDGVRLNVLNGAPSKHHCR